MRICFIADSSSVHVRRIVAHCVRKNDDILILSSSPYVSDIPGARTLYLVNGDNATSAVSSQNGKHQQALIKLVKSFTPMSLNRVLRSTKRGFQLLRKHTACRQEIERFNPDVIYCFRSFPEGMLASRCHTRPILLRTAGRDISKLPRYPIYRQIIRRAVRSADVVVTESLWERNLLWGLCGDRVDPKVIIIGVDTTLFRPPESRARLRQKYRLPADAFIAVTSRSLEGDHHGWLVVKAIQAILERCPQLILLYLIPAEMRPRIRTNIQELAARHPRIRLLQGPLPHAQVPEVFGCGNLYISFSSFDGIPNSVLEAMACGLVPVLGELPQLHEWVTHGVNGYFVPQRDTKGLATVVRNLYQNRNGLADMSARCVAAIRARGAHEDCMERTRLLLKSLTS